MLSWLWLCAVVLWLRLCSCIFTKLDIFINYFSGIYMHTSQNISVSNSIIQHNTAGSQIGHGGTYNMGRSLYYCKGAKRANFCCGRSPQKIIIILNSSHLLSAKTANKKWPSCSN